MHYDCKSFPKPHHKYISRFVEYLKERGYSPHFIGFNGKTVTYPPAPGTTILAVA
jgi:hypothetical protein